ncbi:cell division protein SepF [Aneurinibacillus terranovensis]|uniref:cell division protein SepF n=1 Tax=Aneurinibacillus terranovensis TaxID=278991 RepID=UPI00040E0146|nr:cell division protein SepF [Aneurinibacillus terranovensis]
MGVVTRIKDFFGIGSDEYVEEIIEEHYEEEPEESYIRPRKGKQDNVVSLHALKEQNPRVMLIEPKSYDEVQDIADHIRSRRAVVVNLQRVTPEQAKRIVDFLSGTVYALSGAMQKIGYGTFLCVPEHMELQGHITELMYEDKGL